MDLKFVIVLTLSGLSVVSGLTCWVCHSQKSRGECLLKGRAEKCRDHGTMSCQTEVRFHEGMGGNPMITTGCKQTTACENNRYQNNKLAWPSKQCNSRNRNSVCRCCCKGFRCNRKNLLCKRRPLSNSVSVRVAPTPRSDQPPPGDIISGFNIAGAKQTGNGMTILVNVPSG